MTQSVSFAVFFACDSSFQWPDRVFCQLFFSVAHALINKRHREEARECFGVGTIAGVMLFGTLGVGCRDRRHSSSVFLHSKLNEIGREASWLVEAALGLLWGAFVCVACNSIAKPAKRYINQIRPRPIPNDTCGPIVWRPLDGT